MALFNYFSSPTTFDSTAIQSRQAFKEVRTTNDGFHILSSILHRLLPQFGCSPLHSASLIAKITFSDGETIQEFHNRAIDIFEQLEYCKVTINATVFF